LRSSSWSLRSSSPSASPKTRCPTTPTGATAIRSPSPIFASRYLFACDALATTKEAYAFPMFEVFKEYSLPNAIRTNNGVPLASPIALFGLSKLSA
jgi:hypothetical protein